MSVPMESFQSALLGGALIGLASVLMLLFNGRILGISGIVGGILMPSREGKQWRIAFLAGLLLGGLVVSALVSNPFAMGLSRSWASLVAAGLLVGFGTRLGNGCTSGHGICGVSRLSPRSILATLTFMGAGALVVFVINHLLGGTV
jgi:uncharacterized protein